GIPAHPAGLHGRINRAVLGRGAAGLRGQPVLMQAPLNPALHGWSAAVHARLSPLSTVSFTRRSQALALTVRQSSPSRQAFGLGTPGPGMGVGFPGGLKFFRVGPDLRRRRRRQRSFSFFYLWFWF